MASGIEVPEFIVDSFKKLSERKFTAVVIKIQDEKLLIEKEILPSTALPSEAWTEVIEGLNENECRFIICDFQVKETELVTRSKLIAIKWTPDYANIRSRMIYASTLNNLCDKISIQKTLQPTELGEITYKAVKESVFGA